MAPAKQKAPTVAILPLLKKTITTRSKTTTNTQNVNPDDHHGHQQQQQQLCQHNPTSIRSKRKADQSPLKNERGVKRSALGNLTNAAVISSTDSTTDHGSDVGVLLKSVKNVAIVAPQQHTFVHPQFANNNAANNRKPVTEVFTKPDPDGPRTRGATKILTRAASRQQLGLKNNNNQANINANSTNNQIGAATFTTVVKNEPSTVAGHTLRSSSQVSVITTTQVKKEPILGNNDGGEQPKRKGAAQGTNQQQQQQLSKIKRRISNDFEQTGGDSLYVSASEDFPSNGSLRLSDHFPTNNNGKAAAPAAETKKTTSGDSCKSSLSIKQEVIIEEEPESPRKRTPEDVEDYDLANWNDVYQVSHYAQEIFAYQKNREPLFAIPDYMPRQPHISKWMRALLVDWMVEIQESFELNHETLYLAVKIVDIYLSRAPIQKDSLQLLGAAALFIASKFDERVPPTVDDFQYICDGAYQRREMILMEMTVFKTIGFDLGIPLSYRFLRRYARVNRLDMPVLTLARYILEYTLMDYAIVSIRDSKLACAALFIAMRMSNMAGWNKTLEFYSGYKVEEFADVVILLNSIMTRKPKESLNTVRHKYSHELFFESAKKPLITDLEKMFDTTDYKAPPPPPPAAAAVSASASSTGGTVTTITTKTNAPSATLV